MKHLRRLQHLPKLLAHAIVGGWHDRVLGLSAEAAFWQLLSMPSLFLATIASLGYVSRWSGPSTPARVEARIESTLAQAFTPEVVDAVISPTLREILHGERIDVISIGFGLALWAGSSATATFVNTITIAYGMREQRGPVRSRLLALWLFLGSVVVGVVLLPLLVLGPGLVVGLVPKSQREDARTLITDAYYPLVIVLILLGLTTLYHLAPPRRLPWRRGAPGAVVALCVFLAGSIGIRSYISTVLENNHAYVTLTAPIAVLLFFYALALGVLLGAEFNAAIEQLAPTQERSGAPPGDPRPPRRWHRLPDADQLQSPPGIDS